LYKKEADILKNSCKAAVFNYDSHDCNVNGKYILQEGWLATLEGFEVSLAGIFQHICPPIQKQILQTSKIRRNK
jgi:hypothetical protein